MAQDEVAAALLDAKAVAPPTLDDGFYPSAIQPSCNRHIWRRRGLILTTVLNDVRGTTVLRPADQR